MEINACNTLISMAAALQTDENAKKNPFIVITSPKEDKNISVAMCGDKMHLFAMHTAATESVIKNMSKKGVLTLYGTITDAVIRHMKEEEGIPEFALLHMLSHTLSVAMSNNFAEERKKKIHAMLRELAEDCDFPDFDKDDTSPAADEDDAFPFD